jgi:hypothetical protein
VERGLKVGQGDASAQKHTPQRLLSELAARRRQEVYGSAELEPR